MWLLPWGGLGACTGPSLSPRPGAVVELGELRDARICQAEHSGEAYSEGNSPANMTSSYNLDFLPDMMVESRLLVPGDRM